MKRLWQRTFSLLFLALAGLEVSCSWTNGGVALDEIRTGRMSVYSDGSQILVEGRWKLTGGTKAKPSDPDDPIPRVNVAEIHCGRERGRCDETLASMHPDSAYFMGDRGGLLYLTPSEYEIVAWSPEGDVIAIKNDPNLAYQIELRISASNKTAEKVWHPTPGRTPQEEFYRWVLVSYPELE